VNFKKFHERMERQRRLVSPRQAIKLLLWIEENSAIIDRMSPRWALERMKVRERPTGAAASPVDNPGGDDDTK